MNAIEQRVKQVVSSRVESFVLETLGGDDRSRLKEARQREREARMRAMARAAARDDPGGSPSSGSKPRVIEEMMAEEDCPICTRILGAVAEMDEPRRTKGVAEYGEFRQAIEQSEEAAVEVLENSEVLDDALQTLQEVQL